MKRNRRYFFLLLKSESVIGYGCHCSEKEKGCYSSFLINKINISGKYSQSLDAVLYNDEHNSN